MSYKCFRKLVNFVLIAETQIYEESNPNLYHVSTCQTHIDTWPPAHLKHTCCRVIASNLGWHSHQRIHSPWRPALTLAWVHLHQPINTRTFQHRIPPSLPINTDTLPRRSIHQADWQILKPRTTIYQCLTVKPNDLIWINTWCFQTSWCQYAKPALTSIQGPQKQSQ